MFDEDLQPDSESDFLSCDCLGDGNNVWGKPGDLELADDLAEMFENDVWKVGTDIKNDDWVLRKSNQWFPLQADSVGKQQHEHLKFSS